MLQACLNGRRARAERPAASRTPGVAGGEHSAVPLTPEELAADARRAVAAGAAELHVHPRVPGGRDTTEPGAAGATVRAIRAACPGVPLGLTTGLWTTDGDAEDPVVAAAEIDEMLVARGVSAPQLHHGAGSDAWMVLDAALARGRDVRIGLEDTTLLPDGRTARDNAELVAEAARRHRA